MGRKNKIKTKIAAYTTSKQKLNEVLTDEDKSTTKNTPPPATPPPLHTRRIETNV